MRGFRRSNLGIGQKNRYQRIGIERWAWKKSASKGGDIICNALYCRRQPCRAFGDERYPNQRASVAMSHCCCRRLKNRCGNYNPESLHMERNYCFVLLRSCFLCMSGLRDSFSRLLLSAHEFVWCRLFAACSVRGLSLPESLRKYRILVQQCGYLLFSPLLELSCENFSHRCCVLFGMPLIMLSLLLDLSVAPRACPCRCSTLLFPPQSTAFGRKSHLDVYFSLLLFSFKFYSCVLSIAARSWPSFSRRWRSARRRWSASRRSRDCRTLMPSTILCFSRCSSCWWSRWEDIWWSDYLMITVIRISWITCFGHLRFFHVCLVK